MCWKQWRHLQLYIMSYYLNCLRKGQALTFIPFCINTWFSYSSVNCNFIITCFWQVMMTTSWIVTWSWSLAVLFKFWVGICTDNPVAVSGNRSFYLGVATLCFNTWSLFLLLTSLGTPVHVRTRCCLKREAFTCSLWPPCWQEAYCLPCSRCCLRREAFACSLWPHCRQEAYCLLCSSTSHFCRCSQTVSFSKTILASALKTPATYLLHQCRRQGFNSF